MILPDFILASRQNLTLKETGIDSYKSCINKDWFKNYPYKVEYSYNSRGFRDAEWPATIHELGNAIWCIGDSFTAGLGSPLDHSWVTILQKKTDARCINVSMDGASNEWIARKALRVLNEIRPAKLVIQWSYISRGELLDSMLSDEDRRISMRSDVSDISMITNFITLIDSVNQAAGLGQVVHSLIPHCAGPSGDCTYNWAAAAGSQWPPLPVTPDEFKQLPQFVVNELETAKLLAIVEQFSSSRVWQRFDKCVALTQTPNLFQVRQVDYARDYHHYDLITATNFVNSIIQLVAD